MPRSTVHFDEEKPRWGGSALKAFTAAAVLGVVGWQFTKWWQNPIDHEGVKLADNYVVIGDRKVSDPFTVMMNGMGVREGEGATLGTGSETHTFAEAYEKTKKLADQIDPRIAARETEAKNIIQSYNQFLQTHPQPNLKYKFLKDSMMRTLGAVQYEDEQHDPEIGPLFQLFRQAARDAFADLRLQALRDPVFAFQDAMRSAVLDSFNTADDPDAQKYVNMYSEALDEIMERRQQFEPAPKYDYEN